MHKKYSCLQIGIHWLVLLLVIIAWSSIELRGFAPRSY
ncbi:cytochrome b561, partial [Yersinia pestis]